MLSSTNTIALALAVACPILAAPGLWLLRQHSAPRTFAAILLLLTATASGYISLRLWLHPAATGNTPLFRLTATPGHFQVITPDELPAALIASRGRPVLLEFYADWCSSCIVWKETVFNRADVQTVMTPFVLLQIDASELTPDVQTLLDQHQLVGLPAILAYNRQGEEQASLRLLGEMPAAGFIDWIKVTALPQL